MELTDLEKQDQEKLIELANRLNKMLEKDRATFTAIFKPIYLTTRNMADSPAQVFEISDGVYALNVLGIVAGTVSLDTNSFTLCIDATHDKIVGFKVLNCKQ